MKLRPALVFSAILALLGIAYAPVALASDPAYIFVTLDPPSAPGATSSIAINASGQIAGSCSDSAGNHGYLYSGGVYTILDDPNSKAPDLTSATAIDASGNILGGYYKDLDVFYFLYSAGAFLPLNDPKSSLPPTIDNVAQAQTHASSCNALGQIVGYYYANGTWHGFLYNGGTYTNIDDPSAGKGTYPAALNSAGQIVGIYDDAQGNQHGFLYSAGVFTNIDDPDATSHTSPVAINASGQIIGTYEYGSTTHGFLYQGGGFTNLIYPNAGASTIPLAINSSGQIVGEYVNAPGFGGFLYSGGTFADFSYPNASRPASPNAINDAGQIVGTYGDSNGNVHGFLATPIAIVPAVTAFTPGAGPIGTRVTISGTNLAGTTAVTFGGVSATTFAVASATSLTATVPTGAVTGLIRVTTPRGFATSKDSFTIFAISGITPTFGPSGASVLIMGTGFTGATSVKFNGTPAVFKVTSDTRITATVPAGATSGLIEVIIPGGTAVSVAKFIVTLPAPTIKSFTPASGPIGTKVTIAGTNFTGVTAVKFNDTVAKTFAVATSTSISATVPVGATTGKVSVTEPSGTATSVSNFTVTIPAPTIASFTPLTGIPGTRVGIRGTNLLGTTAVTFNGKPATFTVETSSALIAIVPAGATTGKIKVTTPSGTAISTTNFTIAAPTITSFSPMSGVVGITVKISGTNFTGATAVKFNGKPAATFSVLSASSLAATVPTGATTGKISVTTPGGTATSIASFTVKLPAPTITSFSPASGKVGTHVVIKGTSLTGATAVHFDGKPATTFAVEGSTAISATVPVGAATGKVSVITPSGIASSTTVFTVTK